MKHTREDEQRQAILTEWRTWKRAHPDWGATGTDAMLFHSYLQAEQPHLLSGTGTGAGSWRAVHGILLWAGAVTN